MTTTRTHTHTSTLTMEERYILDAIGSFEKPSGLPEIYSHLRDLLGDSEVEINEELCATIVGQLIQRDLVERHEPEAEVFADSKT